MKRFLALMNFLPHLHAVLRRSQRKFPSNVAMRVIPRRSVNYVANWQAQDDKYLSFENLVRLNNQLTYFDNKMSKSDKKELRKELQLTYFARFHNLIREEFQYDKSLVEERLRTWSRSRLRAEGVTLFDLSPSSKGNLFQDKVIRFQNSAKSRLPTHQFSPGDSIRMTQRGLDPLRSEGVEGVVLERSFRHIDVCIKASSASSIDFAKLYRLDQFVNRVAYDRMINALQLFLNPEAGTTCVSSIVRDLILYSYPNSMLRLANSPGGAVTYQPPLRSQLTYSNVGLRLALPDLIGTADDASATVCDVSA